MLNELLVAVGANIDLYKSLEQVWGDMAKAIPAFAHLRLTRISDNGVQVSTPVQ